MNKEKSRRLDIQEKYKLLLERVRNLEKDIKYYQNKIHQLEDEIEIRDKSEF